MIKIVASLETQGQLVGLGEKNLVNFWCSNFFWIYFLPLQLIFPGPGGKNWLKGFSV